ncbi:amidohydrolase [soil metagenome]
MKTLFINGIIFQINGQHFNSIGFDSKTKKIIYSGNTPDLKIYDSILDLNGKLVLPAFTDAHVHLYKGSQVNSEIDLRNASCFEDIQNAFNNYDHHNKTWISGGYFAESNFNANFKIDKSILDKLSPDVPVILSRFDHHSGIANTKALELSEIAQHQNNFNSSELIMEHGLLTGEVKERAFYFILDKMPQKTLKEKASDLRKLIKEMHSAGITSVGDITLPDDLDVYEECLKEGDIDLNINCILPFEEFKNIDSYKKRFEKFPELRFGCFKAFYDGSLSSKTAYYFDNYIGTDSNGIRTEIVNSGRFEELALQIDKAGYQMAVHAIGDKAVSELLDLNEKLNIINGKRDRRFRIEHAQHIHPDDIQRFKELNVIASVQPAHLFSDAATSTKLLTHSEREHSYRRIINIDGKLILGTDYPIVDYSPFKTIYYAVTRKGAGFENGFHNENRLNVEECIEAYTTNNAYAIYEETSRGLLNEGYFADMIVLRNNIFDSDENEIQNLKVDMTVRNGNLIFEQINTP